MPEVTIHLTDEEARRLRARGRICSTNDALSTCRDSLRATVLLDRLHDALPPDPIKAGDVVRYKYNGALPGTVLHVHGKKAWVDFSATGGTDGTEHVDNLERVA